MIFSYCGLFVIVHEDGPLEEGRPLVIHTPAYYRAPFFLCEKFFALSVKV